VTTTGIDDTTRRLATTLGVTAIAADACFFVFSAVGQPFGSLTAAGNARTPVLAGWLAWNLRTRTGMPAAGLALAGSAIGVGGSWMVLSGTSGWFLAAFVSGVGFALVGPSVILASRSLLADGLVSRRLAIVGQTAGWFTLAGLTGVVPALMRLDDPVTAPGWSWLPFVGWVSTFILLPAWAIWLGRRGAVRRSGARAAEPSRA
jgi:hypothetical protein